MSDPLGFPVLAGSAITQAFGFLYGRLAVLIDRHRSGNSEKEQESGSLAIQPGADDSWQPDEATLEEYLPSLRSLAAALGVYDKHPEIIDGEDEDLRRNLGALWVALQDIYHREIPLPLDSGVPGGVKISQKDEEVTGKQTGIISDYVSRDALVVIDQKAKNIHKDAEQIGAKIKRIE